LLRFFLFAALYRQTRSIHIVWLTYTNCETAGTLSLLSYSYSYSYSVYSFYVSGQDVHVMMPSRHSALPPHPPPPPPLLPPPLPDTLTLQHWRGRPFPVRPVRCNAWRHFCSEGCGGPVSRTWCEGAYPIQPMGQGHATGLTRARRRASDCAAH
jgi:hypothetical protein